MTAMDTILPSDEDREMMRDALRGVLEQVWPASGYEEAMRDPARLNSAWQTLCQQGFATLGSDTDGGGLREIVLVLEELGRAACIAPFLPAAIANLLLAPRRDLDPAIAPFLDAMHAGEIVPAISFGDCDRGRAVGSVSYTDGKASGTLRFVEAGEIATHILVFSAKGPSLVVVSCEPETTKVTPTRAMGAPGLCEIEFDGASAWAVDLDAETVAEAIDISRIGLAARVQASLRYIFDMVVDYSKERQQFGRTIGSFQALQHKFANNLIALEGARLSVEFAAECHDRGDPRWRYFAASAFATASANLRQVALENHHGFGAIGYAEEHEAPRHFKRAHVDLIRHGGYAEARADLAGYYLGAESRHVPELDLGEAGNAFREEVRAWLEEMWPPERAGYWHSLPYEEREYDPDFAKALGAKGWIGLNWPKEFGGQERSPLELIGFMEVIEQFEAPRAGAPIHGNMLIVKGTPEQQAERMPDIMQGKAIYGMGLSEPNSGSDLGSLKTRAVRDGDDWVITGQKIWCTTFFGDYLLVAARTDTEARPQSAGISAFIVPTDAPGLTISPTGTMYDGRFANLYFDDVRVPNGDMIGPVNGGWDVIMSALVTERGYYGGQVAMQLVKQFEKLCDYLRHANDGNGKPLAQDALVRDRIGDLAAQMEVARRMYLSCAKSAESGVTPVYDAAISKVYSGELMERFGEACLDLLGLEGTLSTGAKGAIIRGQLEQKLRYSLMWVISLGTGEIQRTLIARTALGLPSK